MTRGQKQQQEKQNIDEKFQADVRRVNEDFSKQEREVELSVQKPFHLGTFSWTEWETEEASGAITGTFAVELPPVKPLDKADDEADLVARSDLDRKYYDQADEARKQVDEYLKSDDAKRTMSASVEEVLAHVDKKVVKVQGLELKHSKVYLAWANEEHWETELTNQNTGRRETCCGEEQRTIKLSSSNLAGRHLVRTIKPYDTVEVWLVEKNWYYRWQCRAPRWLCCLCDSWMCFCCKAAESVTDSGGQNLSVSAKMIMKKVDRAVKAAADEDVIVHRELDTETEFAKQADALQKVPLVEVGELKMKPIRILGNIAVKTKPKLLLGGLEFIHPLVPLKMNSSLLDMPTRDHWRFYYSRDKTNPVPPQMRKFVQRFVLGLILFSVLCLRAGLW